MKKKLRQKYERRKKKTYNKIKENKIKFVNKL